MSFITESKECKMDIVQSFEMQSITELYFSCPLIRKYDDIKVDVKVYRDGAFFNDLVSVMIDYERSKIEIGLAQSADIKVNVYGIFR